MNTAAQVTILEREISRHVYAIRNKQIMSARHRRRRLAQLREIAEEFGQLMLPAVVCALSLCAGLIIFG